MKTNGIVREIDKLGRIVVPIELRRSLDINVGDNIEISSKGDTVILRKQSPSCVFCGSYTDLTEYEGKKVCAKCIAKLSAQTK